jgi:hypothetical protein
LKIEQKTNQKNTLKLSSNKTVNFLVEINCNNRRLLIMTASSSLNSDIHHENSKSQNDLNSQPSKILKNSSTNSDISKTTEVVTSNTDRPTASHDASDKWKASMNIKSDVEPSPLHLMNPQLMNNKQDTTAKK